MVIILLGTRAQLIKMAPVILALQREGAPFRFVSTGQHRETMDEMCSDFGIRPPDVILYHGSDIVSIWKICFWFIRLLASGCIRGRKILGVEGKGIILVHGDTLSTLLGVLYGKVTGLAVGHIESGLRSYNYFHPFPEEIIRVVVSRLSSVLFCPGKWAVKNVEKSRKVIVDTKSNTLYDTIRMNLRSGVVGCDKSLGRFAIVSLHRYENIFNKERFLHIVSLLEKIATAIKLLFILHPPTVNQLKKYGLFERVEKNANIICHPRMCHSSFLERLQCAEFVVTDGGSLQEETSYLGKPCLLFRKATERPEGIGANVVLSDFDESVIDHFVDNYKSYCVKDTVPIKSPVDIIIDYLKKSEYI